MLTQTAAERNKFQPTSERITQARIDNLIENDDAVQTLLALPTIPPDYTLEGITLCFMWIKAAETLDKSEHNTKNRSRVRHWVFTTLGDINITRYDFAIAAIFGGYNVFISDDGKCIRVSEHMTLEGKKPLVTSGYSL